MNGGGITATPGGRDSISSGGGAPPPQAFAPRVGKNIRPAPSEIEFKDMKFLITDRPSDATMVAYIEELCRHSVKDVVRVCEPTYQTDLLAQHGITVTNLVFDDGTAPPAQVVEEWLSLVRARRAVGTTVAVHCVAGLGRAPVLVAIALMELGMRYEDAVQHIRTKRRGAINAKQLAYLEKYRPKGRLKNGKTATACCVQ
ncbi:PRL-1 phosphatase [Hyalella azteca]|uniref:Protein tyrosine phosphatase type IVA 3 n=1 Tax=Hyalella azteca TaxID=294128 RepID=A0A8B7NAV6_HYAAZ|nr:PRL-1 phosphatase [Hyalella azteca]XP_018010710.1 PRL-1 phosphatase [Hyalella azteca]XP_018010711.1 PRL-1 phosphatase [Hyalella azteca]